MKAASAATLPALVGCDFSSSPSRRKPIVVAHGRLAGGRVLLERLDFHPTLAGWAAWLAVPGRWVGGFDLPFGLPRELVETLAWPGEWPALIAHYRGLTRGEVRNAFSAFCRGRPPGGKFAHRGCDGPAGSSPSMKWVNPPVAYMLHAGVPLLVDAGVHLPVVMPADPSADRVALEAYPGLLAREVLGRRSYKADSTARQTPERLIARKDLVGALEAGRGPAGPLRGGLRLKLSPAQHDVLVADAQADALDAVLCLMQAGWALAQHEGGAASYGLPAHADPLEGWIISAQRVSPK